MGRRILIVTEDLVASSMAGPAIRAWQMATALSSRHDVVLASTVPAELPGEGFAVATVDNAGIDELERWCDVIVLQGYVLHRLPRLRTSAKVLVVDLYDPLHLEVLELTRRDAEPGRSTNVANARATLAEQLRRGDFFLCAGIKQRDLWLGFLASLGRVNADTYDEDPSLRSLVADVPFGLPDEPPRRTGAALRGVVEGIAAEDEVVLWGGGVYDWLDPETLVRAAALLRDRRPRLRVVFMGVRHPNPAVQPARSLIAAQRLSDELELTGRHVFFNEGWVPYAERQNFLLDADVGVSLHLEHLETTFSFRARIADYLWAGLPVVSTAGDAFADLVAEHDLGAVVAARQPEALADALHGLLADPARRAQCAERVARVAERFRWSVVLAPLVAFCDSPRRAPDRPWWTPVGEEASTSAASGGESPGGWEGVRRDVRTLADRYRQGGAAAVARVVRDKLTARRTRPRR